MSILDVLVKQGILETKDLSSIKVKSGDSDEDVEEDGEEDELVAIKPKAKSTKPAVQEKIVWPKRSIKIDLPIVIFDIIQKIKKNGFDAYIVGGCLRDLILKREVND